MIRTLFTVGLGSLLIVYAVILSFTESFAWYRIVWVILGIGLIVLKNRTLNPGMILLYVLVYGSVIVSCLFAEVQNQKCIQAGKQRTADVIVVLGCKTPSRAFNWRAEAAAGYLKAHPETTAVVTGGQGSDEAISEGEAFHQRLLQLGISEDRIQTETESTSTRENFINADHLYAVKNKTVGIVTNSYHIYRSILIAGQCGYTDVFGIPAKTLLFYEPDNILREVMALAKAMIVK
jgi:uncharacterized SAM-binding protein YcdF (DUF218 family)